MACSSCGSSKDGKPGGCQSNGGCSTGGCNRLNTYDWLSDISLSSEMTNNYAEVSFKSGARKTFYNFPQHLYNVEKGDMVVVETGNGYDVGQLSLKGEMVRLQMKKRPVKDFALLTSVVRRANDRDLERLREARAIEQKTMVRARAIARSLGVEMKVGDVEYQGDKRKATFYYTADGRIDFRELIKLFAREFKVKIEMRQIGARQESARIGGLGSCGRELCCSTWLTNFKSVSTSAARYQNLAINQSKLSGQCGRLKCCLNYELDTYLDALDGFPRNADRLETEAGTAQLLKTDIFKGVMYYIYRGKKTNKTYPVKVERVKAIQALNAKGEKPEELIEKNFYGEELMDYEDVTGAIELPAEVRKKRKRGGRKGGNRSSNRSGNNKGPRNSNSKSNTKGKDDSKQGSKPKSKTKPNNRKDGAKKDSKKKMDNKNPKNQSKGKDDNKNRPNKRRSNSNNKKRGNKPNPNKKSGDDKPKE